jgi:5-methylcytosine-specific restriction protein B
MNTADRSVGHIDYAIRRRFAFVDILPSSSPIDDVISDPETKKRAHELFNKVASLFIEKSDDHSIKTYLQADFKAKDVQLGHSYFLAKDTDKQKAIEVLNLKLEYEIKPILLEYVKDGILSEEVKNIIDSL